MPTNKQRRDAARRHLERQLQRRQEREAARRRYTLIASIVGTVALIAIILIVVVMSGSDHKKNKTAASSTPSASSSASTTPSASPSASSTVRAAVGKSVSFAGVTVHGATDLGGAPAVTSTSTTDPAKLEIKDLVVGKGKVAAPTSTVSVEYVGVLYKNGLRFDSSWDRGGQPVSFPLTGVIKGFTEGIGGTTGIAPMHVGGRRIIIIPAALGYGSQASGSIPANSPLVFVVDLKSVG